MAGVNGLCAARLAMGAVGQGAGLVKEGQTVLGAVLALSSAVLRSVRVSPPLNHTYVWTSTGISCGKLLLWVQLSLILTSSIVTVSCELYSPLKVVCLLLLSPVSVLLGHHESIQFAIHLIVYSLLFI